MKQFNPPFVLGKLNYTAIINILGKYAETYNCWNSLQIYRVDKESNYIRHDDNTFWPEGLKELSNTQAWMLPEAGVDQAPK